VSTRQNQEAFGLKGAGVGGKNLVGTDQCVGVPRPWVDAASCLPRDVDAAVLECSARSPGSSIAGRCQPAAGDDGPRKGIALALSACPPGPAEKAAAYVLGTSGYIKG
jgi:hypothetical protein